METGNTNLFKSIRAMRAMVGPLAVQMAEDALTACRDSDALISLAVFAPFGKSIAEIVGVPLINVEPTPTLPTRASPAAGWPVQRNLGGLHNRLSGHAMLFVIWQWYGPYVNHFRHAHGLPPYNSASFYRILKSTPLLGAYSPTVIPHPPDWDRDVHVTGYFYADTEAEWSPSPELRAFLDGGQPPVYVGFGSMAGRDNEQVTAMVLAALEKTRQRGLLLTGWGGIRAISVPDGVFVLDSAPHSWLFPRMAAVMHHGGAGTTAEGLRAGIPSIIIPFAVDQPFWGKRVHDLGIGPAPIPRKKLTVEKLVQAIQSACAQPEMKQRATALGTVIRAERGVDNAVKFIGQHLEG
jgi:UDP:flavonoid glycosyltransferase YjiC (YdhE family)